MDQETLLLLEVAERIAFERGRQQALGPGYEDRDIVDDLTEVFSQKVGYPFSILAAMKRGYLFGEHEKRRDELEG